MVALGGQGCVVAPGGVCGCSGGACVVACMVAPGGHVWLLWGVCMVAPGGVYMVAPRGVHGCSQGTCMVAPGGGGMHGIRLDTEIRSMSGRYASYWNAFLFTFAVDEFADIVGRWNCPIYKESEQSRTHWSILWKLWFVKTILTFQNGIEGEWTHTLP